MRTVTIIFLALTIVLSCRHRTDPSDLAHERGIYVSKPLAGKWIAVSEAEMKSVANNFSQIKSNPDFRALPLDHPLTKRLQKWVDLIDSTIREGADFDAVPKPQIAVLDDHRMVQNAFASSIPVFYKTKFADLSPVASDDPLKPAFLWPKEGALVAEVFNAEDVFSSLQGVFRTNISDNSEWIQDVVSESDPNCEFRLNHSQEVTFSKNCKLVIEKDIDVQGIVSFAAINWIAISLDLIKTLKSEEMVLAIISHELAHYYRNHPVFEIDESIKLNYFYDVLKRSGNGRPSEKSSLESLAKEINAAAEKVSGQWSEFFEGQVYPASFYELFGSLAESFPESISECKILKNFYLTEVEQDSFDFEEDQTGSPYADKDIVELRKRFNALAKTCFPLIKGNKLKNFFETNDKILERFEKRLLLSHGHRPRATDFANLYELYVDEISQKLDDFAKAWRVANEQGMGFYTFEEEADELGAEFLSLIGVNPAISLELYLQLGKLQPSYKNFGSKLNAKVANILSQVRGLSADECRILYRNKWIGSDNKLTRITIGSLEDPHHGSCFRAYNIDMEIQRHKYMEAFVPKNYSFNDAQWSKMLVE